MRKPLGTMRSTEGRINVTGAVVLWWCPACGVTPPEEFDECPAVRAADLPPEN